MPLSPGQMLNNRYRVVKLLGQGGLGAIYRVWDTMLNIPCALKENLAVYPDFDMMEQFQIQASILAKLSHPCLPRVTDHFSITGQGQYLVMDLIEGEDLHTILERSASPPSEEQVLTWIDQVCDALIYLHSRKPQPVIHRDLKPGAIMLTPEGRIILVSFSVAKLYEPKGDTGPGARAFTPGYSPPEQYGMARTDARADIYALGATLYCLLTRQTPVDSLERLTGEKELPSPRKLNPLLSPGVERIIFKAMELDPDRRYSSVTTMRSDLRQLPSPQPQRSVQEQSPSSPTTPVSKVDVSPGPASIEPPPLASPQPAPAQPAAKPILQSASAFLDFDIYIDEGQGQDYPLSARSPAGEAKAVMHFPFDQINLENRLLNLKNALLSSGSRRRAYLSPEEQVVQSFGRELFAALLPGDMRACYERSKERALQQGKGLRIKLHIQPPNLTALPWEYLFDPGESDYLSLSTKTPVVRHFDIPQPVLPMPVKPPLRILAMCASPRGLEEIDIPREKERLNRAVAGLQANGLLEITWLEGQGWNDLQRALRRDGPWHIFHFVGHGRFNRATGEGQLALADEKGEIEALPAVSLARLLADHSNLRLVFLNACGGAEASLEDAFSGLASALVRRGMPAVIAMQYQITDQAAIRLSQAFYEALADGLPVDASIAEARKAVSFAIGNTLEWGTPVLYLRSQDGVLFDWQ